MEAKWSWDEWTSWLSSVAKPIFLHTQALMLHLNCPKLQHDFDPQKTPNTIQLSPEGDVNNGGFIPRREASREVYIHRSSPTLRGIVVLVFAKSDG